MGGDIGGGGNLVGPDHPMFNHPSFSGSEENPRNPDFFFPGYEDNTSGLPVPRFDPYGPVPGPMGRFGPGQGGGGRRGGRGGKRGVGGDPNPDHFQPPGFNSDDNSLI